MESVPHLSEITSVGFSTFSISQNLPSQRSKYLGCRASSGLFPLPLLIRIVAFAYGEYYIPQTAGMSTPPAQNIHSFFIYFAEGTLSSVPFDGASGMVREHTADTAATPTRIHMTTGSPQLSATVPSTGDMTPPKLFARPMVMPEARPIWFGMNFCPSATEGLKAKFRKIADESPSQCTEAPNGKASAPSGTAPAGKVRYG